MEKSHEPFRRNKKSNIVITHQGLSVGRRYEIVVNGRLVGMMSTPQARFTLPRGAYFLTIRSGKYLPIGKKGKTLDFTVSTSTTFLSEDNAYTHITFSRSWLWWIYRIFKRKNYYDVTATNTQEAPAVVRPRKTWLQRYMEKHKEEIAAATTPLGTTARAFPQSSTPCIPTPTAP